MQNSTDWHINIDYAARRANEVHGYDVATSVFMKYGAKNFYDLCSCYYDFVFDELDFLANEL